MSYNYEIEQKSFAENKAKLLLLVNTSSGSLLSFKIARLVDFVDMFQELANDFDSVQNDEIEDVRKEFSDTGMSMLKKDHLDDFEVEAQALLSSLTKQKQIAAEPIIDSLRANLSAALDVLLPDTSK